MKKFLLTSLIVVLTLPFCAKWEGICFAQNVGINNTGNTPNSSAMLDVDASPANNKGMLIPRLTTVQQNAINNPATGLMIYNTDCNTINYYNGASWIAIGNAGSVTTPGSITGITSTCQNSTGIAYSITAVGGATGYNWSMPPGSTVATGQGTASITVNFGTTSGSICVTAANACGTSNASCSAITLTGGAPSAPTASSATITGTSFTLNWTSSAGATGYFVDVSVDPAFGSFITGFNNFSAGNVLTTNITGLSCTTPYYCRVRAADVCGSGSNSTSLSVTTTGAPAAPTASSASIGSTSFTLNWTSSTGATGYFVDVSIDPAFGSFITGFSNFSAGNVLTTNVTGLTCATAYYCRVRAANICGSGSNSSSLTVTTSATGPAAPTAATSVVGYNQIVWNWNTVSGASGYKYNTTNTYSTATDNGSSTTFTQTSLTCNTIYNLYVWSYNAGCGGSASSTDIQVTTAPCITGASSSTFCSYTSNCAGSTFTDSRDAQVYNDVQIYNQCWMAQNLNWGTQVTGTSSAVAYGNKFCYSDVAANCTIYGGLYQWQNMIMNGGGSVNTPPGPQGVCPPGWHVPTDYEWDCMQENLGETPANCTTNGGFFTTMGVNLKIANGATYMGQSGSFYWDNQTGHTNSTGFTAIAGGNYPYNNLDQTGYWTSSTLNGSNVYGRSMYFVASPDGIYRESTESQTGFGWEVRCIKN